MVPGWLTYPGSSMIPVRFSEVLWMHSRAMVEVWWSSLGQPSYPTLFLSVSEGAAREGVSKDLSHGWTQEANWPPVFPIYPVAAPSQAQMCPSPVVPVSGVLDARSV